MTIRLTRVIPPGKAEDGLVGSSSNTEPVSTIPDHRQEVVLLLIRRWFLGNEDQATQKSKPVL